MSVPIPRSEVPGYLEEKHGKPARVEVKTLAKMAVVGGGPEFIKFGRRVAYMPEALDKWVASRRSAPAVHTSAEV